MAKRKKALHSAKMKGCNDVSSSYDALIHDLFGCITVTETSLTKHLGICIDIPLTPSMAI